VTTTAASAATLSVPSVRSPLGVRRLLLVLLLAGAALRVHGIGKESVWLDEAFSITVANAGFDTIIAETSEDVHPPLYYMLLEAWMSVAGTSETAARLLSTIFDLGLVVATFALGRRLAGETAGLLAAFLLAISPFHVEFSQEARMYTLLALLGALSTFALIRLGTLPDRMASATHDGPSRYAPLVSTWWWAYVAAATLMIYTHAYSVFMMAAHTVVVGAALARGRLRFFERWLVAVLAVALLYQPWLSVFAVQFSHVQRGFWIPEPGWSSPADTLITYAGSEALLWILGPLALWGLVRAWRRADVAPGISAGLLLTVWLIAPIALPLLLSLIGSPVFLPKYTIAATVPFALLVALGLGGLHRYAIGATAAAVLVFTGYALSQYYTSPQKDGWRQAVHTLEARAEPGDVVVFYPFFTQIPWDVYRTRRDVVLAPFAEHAERLTATTLPWLLDEATSGHRRAWLVIMQWDTRKPLLVDRLERRYEQVERIREWHIDLYLATNPVTQSNSQSRNLKTQSSISNNQ
jgi:4-amino-4-deoxy-L-arabinose transferase-like glycosyltransferase